MSNNLKYSEQKLNLLKTSFLSFIATAVKLLAGLVINKAVSLYIGPSGIALIGQLQSGSLLAITFAQGGIKSGITKYTAEYGKESNKIPELWSTAAKITLICSSVVGVFLLIFSSSISGYILKSDQYGYVFQVFGFTLVFFTLNQMLLSILNGLKEIRTFISINISQSIYSLVFTTVLIYFLGLNGALLAMVTNQSIIFITVVYRLRDHRVITFDKFKLPINRDHCKNLLNYSSMALTSACVVPISQLLIRNYLGDKLSWSDAGYWQSMWYISSMYLMVVTTALATYYLPRLSEIKSKIDLRREIRNGYIIIIPIIIIISLLIYISREFIVWFLFTDEFRPMLVLFKWQLIGDVIKISSLLLSYIMLAKTMTKAFIFTEIISSVIFVLLSFNFIDYYGLVGISYSYAASYTIYLLLMLAVTRNKVF